MRYRIDGGLFNLRRLRAITKTRTRYICDLQYADDCALLTHTPEQLQEILDEYVLTYELLGLKINIGKTKVMSTTRTANETNIKFDTEPLAVVQQFTYLRSMIHLMFLGRSKIMRF